MVNENGPDAKLAPICNEGKEQVISICKSEGAAYVLTDRRFMVIRLRSSNQHRVSGKDFLAGGFHAAGKIDANTARSYTLVTQLVRDGRFDQIAEDFVMAQMFSQDARERFVFLEDFGDHPNHARFLSDIPNIGSGNFVPEFGKQLLARLELWTGEKFQFWKPRWWQGGAPGWCFGYSDVEDRAAQARR